MRGPSRQKFAQGARRGALADSDTAGNTDDERRLLAVLIEKPRGSGMKKLSGADVIVHKLRDGQVDVRHLVLADALDKARKPREIVVGQSKVDAVAKLGPFAARKGTVGR